MTAISGNFYKVPQKYNQPPENSRSSTYKAAQQTNNVEAGQGHDDLKI